MPFGQGPLPHKPLASLVSGGLDRPIRWAQGPAKTVAARQGIELKLPFMGITISPHLHIHGVYGFSSAGDETSELAPGGHDPSEDEEWQWQGIEPGISIRGNGFEAFANAVWVPDADEEEIELEEAFFTLTELPFLGGLSLRGGQFLNRIGFQNTYHLHAWATVDAPLVSSNFLGEEGLATIGGELTWTTPGKRPAYLSVSVGEAPSHHEEEEEEGHEDEEDEHGEEEGEDEHGHEDEAPAFDGEVVTVGILFPYEHNDFHRYRLSAGAAFGETEEDDSLAVYQLGAEYTWHPAGYDPGGGYVRWTNELFLRDLENEGTDLGFYTQVSSQLSPYLPGALRYGVIEEGPEDRSRLSAILGFQPAGNDLVTFRVQYNYDNLDQGEEHSVWFQTGFNWGGQEVR